MVLLQPVHASEQGRQRPEPSCIIIGTWLSIQSYDMVSAHVTVSELSAASAVRSKSALPSSCKAADQSLKRGEELRAFENLKKPPAILLAFQLLSLFELPR